MDLLGDSQVDLAITSPPYFSEDMEATLRVRRREQKDWQGLTRDLYAFAGQLRPVFVEIYRVLKPGRALVVQSKDIRFGEVLIPLSDQHLAMAQSCGFLLLSRFRWVPAQAHPRRRPTFVKQRRVGQFRVEDGEVFHVLSKSGGLEVRGAIQDLPSDLRALASPVWQMPFRRRKDDHPHVSPRPVISALVQLLSEEGDLVVDPFAGFGTILQVAKTLGRSAIGWEINAASANEAQRRLN
jgi:DNA modification methylase